VRWREVDGLVPLLLLRGRRHHVGLVGLVHWLVSCLRLLDGRSHAEIRLIWPLDVLAAVRLPVALFLTIAGSILLLRRICRLLRRIRLLVIALRMRQLEWLLLVVMRPWLLLIDIGRCRCWLRRRRQRVV
jgi:hypothetical protein